MGHSFLHVKIKTCIWCEADNGNGLHVQHVLVGMSHPVDVTVSKGHFEGANRAVRNRC